MTTGDMAQGELIEMAALLGFQGGKMQVIQEFGTVVHDDCASLRTESTAKAAVLSYSKTNPFSMPKITANYYAGGCGNVRRWRAIKGPI